MLPHVRGAHWEGWGLCPDDVQALQARLLLVLSGQSGCEYWSTLRLPLMYSLIHPAPPTHRMTFCCGTTTRVPARTNWVIRVPRLSGIAPKLLAYLLALVFFCWSHHRCCCWRRHALFAASAVAAVAPRSTRSMRSWRRRWPHCRANHHQCRQWRRWESYFFFLNCL